ncbi:tRNA pseudouridine(38-40) synthase TruA [Methanococcus voltae]|uniref:tRNA pseudouridine synthase n=1 Tax=Methanococcus voltae TaxID=2188 RepID=A0A8J7RKS8_METVO|nr:tRNA pseudouridine(38-40) synthase TruA [Methanococcus voltae]MBP2172398.1 tRNA pseudouridine38-40 synthase [Methanococcus voltae]MBP2200646.1 tRNA pseudouridine38-40 synthase [Methanococcus voltae]
MYIFKVAYDGRYSFQLQPHEKTVCDVLTNILVDCGYLSKFKKPLYYGGRTDLGVSALGNFVIYDLDKEPILSHIYSRCNDSGIWVLGYQKIDSFPEVKHRHYRYILPKVDIYGNFHDLNRVLKVSECLIGTHSFHNLSKRDKKKNRDPVRTIYDIKVSDDKYFITLDIYGKSFLWNMIRKIIGLISKIGISNMTNEEIEEYMKKVFNPEIKVGSQIGPAEGLVLVDAKTDVEFKYDSYVLKKFNEDTTHTMNEKIRRLGVYTSMNEFSRNFKI